MRKTSETALGKLHRNKGFKEFVDNIQTFFNRPEMKVASKVIEFILGVASVWFPTIETIWNLKGAAENFIKLVTECNPFYKLAKNELKNGGEYIEAVSKNEIEGLNNYLKTLDNPKQYCIYQKEQIQIRQDSIDKNWKLAHKFTSPPNFCDNEQADILGEPAKKEFRLVCNYFKDKKNCDKEPVPTAESNLVIRAIVAIKKYYKSISSQFEKFTGCAKSFETLINNETLFNPIREFFQPFKTALKTLTKEIINFLNNSLLGPVLNYLSVGLYGELKALYNTYKFAKEIVGLVNTEKEALDNFFVWGKLVGRIVKIITSLVAGTR
jgi:hypothetical protein